MPFTFKVFSLCKNRVMPGLVERRHNVINYLDSR